MNKKFTSRILSMLLAVLMLISMMPTSVFAASASDIPAEMLDNVFLDALEYTGYKVQAQKDDGTIFKKYSGGATAYLSKISYGLNKYGTETVAKSGTATGLAPDIAGFESSGLCCASYVSYVYYNYLPNIAGIDTSSATRPYNLRTATAYNAAANAWVNAGTARRISFSQNANGNNFIPSEDIPIGSLIIFKHIPTGDIAHVALYAGYYNGIHFVTHVGNDRGPEISSIVGMSKGDYPEAVVQVVTPEFVEAAGKIEVYKKDPKGAALSGAYFIATNTSTGAEYAIGPTDSRGYACTKERLPFGTYKIVETVFPTDYTYSGTKEWIRTVSASNNGVVTIQAVNELKKGNIEVYKKSSGTNEALKGAIFTVYDMSGAKVTTIGPTNDRGYAKSAGIPYGSYRVVETTFPFNYEPDGQTEWKVTIDTAHGSLATVNAYNRLKKGHIEVLKSDAESGKDLSGAEFTVYDLAGEEIAVIGPTDKNGYAKSGEIIYGDYIVKETKVPVNYQPDGDAQWKVTIDDNSPLITLDIANLRQYGMVKVRKTAEDGLVEGLTFRLTGTSEYGESVDMTAVTNAVGTAVFERVPIGTDYTLSEENTPERYVIPEVQNISVEWNKVTERQFDNILKKWRADVLKVDASLRSNGGHENPQMLSLDSDSIVENLGYPYGETQGIEATRHYHIKRIREEIIKQIFTIDAGQHKSYLHSLRPPPGEAPVQPGLYYVPNVVVVVVLFPWGWVPVPSLKVQLHYTTVFSTVNRRVLIFTQCTMFVHSPFIFTQFSAILQNSFSVKNRHNTVPARARGGHILRFFPAEAPHARRAGRYCLPRTPEFHRRSGTRPAGG